MEGFVCRVVGMTSLTFAMIEGMNYCGRGPVIARSGARVYPELSGKRSLSWTRRLRFVHLFIRKNGVMRRYFA